MVDNQHTTPKGVVVTRGTPICQYERALSAAAKPGMLVVYDSNEFAVKKSDGSGVPYGWLGYEFSPVASRPDSIDTEYSSGDIASVVAGGNFEIYGFVTGSTSADVTIYPGTLLEDNGDGTLTPWTSASTKQPVAIAQEYKLIEDATTASVERIHVLSLI